MQPYGKGTNKICHNCIQIKFANKRPSNCMISWKGEGCIIWDKKVFSYHANQNIFSKERRHVSTTTKDVSKIKYNV